MKTQHPEYADVFSSSAYLTGYSSKILADLIKAAKLYNGNLIRLYNKADGQRCPKCTNQLTGEVLLSSCPVCLGTGFTATYENLGEFWTYVDFGPKYRLISEQGNSENPGGVKDSFIVLGAPAIKDQSLLLVVESNELFKVYDVAPHIVALRGTVIAQIATGSRLSLGSPEYGVLHGE